MPHLRKISNARTKELLKRPLPVRGEGSFLLQMDVKQVIHEGKQAMSSSGRHILLDISVTTITKFNGRLTYFPLRDDVWYKLSGK
jgi:hypothetical protein